MIPSPEDEWNATYLGDGAYASYDPDTQMFCVFTHDGLKRTNEVFLERHAWKALKRFADSYFK